LIHAHDAHPRNHCCLNVRYAIRDLACVADEVIQQRHKALPPNVGDPLNFDFQTPPHIIETAYKAMRDGKNGQIGRADLRKHVTAENAKTRKTFLLGDLGG
jgi:alanine-synthesizing transaminase